MTKGKNNKNTPTNNNNNSQINSMDTSKNVETDTIWNDPRYTNATRYIIS